MGIATLLIILLGLAGGTLGQIISRDPQQYTVELLFVMDKRGFDKWYNKTEGGSTPEDKRQATVKRVADFLSSVVVGINNIYESTQQYGLQLDVRLKQIHILEDDIWDSSELRPGTEDEIGTMHALDLFYAWSWKQRDRLGQFDHATLVTGYNAIHPDSPEKATQGVAYNGAMCKSGRVSVTEMTFTYQMVETTAHELGHSLGSVHDGENNHCAASLGYLMSAQTAINSTHRWSFSPCSVNAIRRNIADLYKLGVNCLADTDTGLTPGVELGTLLTADDQCRLLLGPKAFFCREFYDSAKSYNHLCVSMWCSESQEAPNCRNYIASDGFVCGQNKVCKRGQCIPSLKPFSTPVLDTCPQGEQPGEVLQGLTCPALVKQRPWMCYVRVFQQKCCQSCPSIRENTRGCEYGDKAQWCSTRMRYPFDCYRNEKICCRSCRARKRVDKPGCQYGDQNIECQTKLEVPIGCYQNEAVCCETCAKAKSKTNPSCPYGDRDAWCKDKLKIPEGCRQANYLCCGSCANVTLPSTTTTTTTITTTTTTTTTTTPSAVPTTATTSTSTLLLSDSLPLPSGITKEQTTKPTTITIAITTAAAAAAATDEYSSQSPQRYTVTATAKMSGDTTAATTTESPAIYLTSPQPPSVVTPTTTKKPVECGNGDDLQPDLDPVTCQGSVPHGCYNVTVLQTCCTSCASSRSDTRPGCEYGDKFENCGRVLFPYACYHPANALACCASCSLFWSPSRLDCLYGDHHPWCNGLTKRYRNEEWCPLDQEMNHCCGTCLYNDTAVPTLGSQLSTTTLPTPQ
ncbi:hypothetical protein ACOMHN_007140 [Nucella lapillus]